MPELDVLHQVQEKVTKVRRRQTGQSGLRAWPVIFTVTFLAVAVWYLVQSQLGIGVPWWLTVPAALLLTLVGTVVMMWRQRPSSTDAALALDRACNLQERTVTLLSLSAEQKASPAGSALLEDTKEHLHRAQVADHFPLQ